MTMKELNQAIETWDQEHGTPKKTVREFQEMYHYDTNMREYKFMVEEYPDGTVIVKDQRGNSLVKTSSVWVYVGMLIPYNGTHFCVEQADSMTVDNAIEWLKEKVA